MERAIRGSRRPETAFAQLARISPRAFLRSSGSATTGTSAWSRSTAHDTGSMQSLSSASDRMAVYPALPPETFLAAVQYFDGVRQVSPELLVQSQDVGAVGGGEVVDVHGGPQPCDLVASVWDRLASARSASCNRIDSSWIPNPSRMRDATLVNTFKNSKCSGFNCASHWRLSFPSGLLPARSGTSIQYSPRPFRRTPLPLGSEIPERTIRAGFRIARRCRCNRILQAPAC